MPLKISLLLLAAVSLFAACSSSQPAPPAGPQGVACTTEARACPDGSYVGRTRPNCEFAACPSK